MQQPPEINWQTEEEVTAKMEIEAKPVVLLYSADWCGGCVTLKKTLNKYAKQLNEKAYFIYEDCTDGTVNGVALYPTTFIFTGNGNEIKIVGVLNENKIKALLELN